MIYKLQADTSLEEAHVNCQGETLLKWSLLRHRGTEDDDFDWLKSFN